MANKAPSRAWSQLREAAAALGRSPLVRAISGLCSRWAEWGTHGYPPEQQRRLKILNVFAAFVIVATGTYAVQNAFMDYEKYKPIVFINTGVLVVCACLPMLHRFGPIAAAMTLVACEYLALASLSAYLGRNAGLHLQYFIAAAATFVVLGPERLRLVLATICTATLLHLLVWFRFPPEAALIDVEHDLADSLYLQAAIVTTGMITATIWYAFGLVEQARAETESLLRNILPGSVVERLKARPGESIADTFEDASVMFADISGFVPLARRLGARGVVDMLNRLVSDFDALAKAHGLEKIKTIGDAYMAAGGLPVPAPDHTERLVRMAFDMLAAVVTGFGCRPIGDRDPRRDRAGVRKPPGNGVAWSWAPGAAGCRAMGISTVLVGQAIPDMVSAGCAGATGACARRHRCARSAMSTLQSA